MTYDISTDDSATYLNELIGEMRNLLHSGVEFKYAQILVSNEIGRVWSCFHQQHGAPINQEIQRFSVADPPMPDTPSPPAARKITTAADAFATPRPKRRVRSPRTPQTPISGGGTSPNCVLQTKIYIPTAPQFVNGRATRCNYIGRILGPSGITAKHLEKQLDCTILIRGQGSVRDPVREARLIGKNGWEHLTEQLHVLVIAREQTFAKCEEKLNSAAEKIESLLTPDHDELKKDQLVQLAIINGTYTERNAKGQQRSGFAPCE